MRLADITLVYATVFKYIVEKRDTCCGYLCIQSCLDMPCGCMCMYVHLDVGACVLLSSGTQGN